MGRESIAVTASIRENEAQLRQMFSSCDDLKIRKIVTNNIILIAMVLINVAQPYVDNMALSFVSLPVLFILVFLLNYKDLWVMVKNMMPAKVVNAISRFLPKAKNK